MARSTFLYVTYILTTQERLWAALTTHTEFMKQYLFGTQCIIELEPVEGVDKLSITHTIERDPSKFIEAVSGGWPKILSNLKSLLENGAAVLTAPYPTDP